jgi:hypothetical protein
LKPVQIVNRMRKLYVLSVCLLALASAGFSQTVKSVVDVPGQEIRILTGTTGDFKKVCEYYITFDYSDIGIGGYENEAAYIDYMREDAELRKKSPDEWEKTWYQNREEIFEPKFLEVFHKYAGSKITLDPNAGENRYKLKLHTQFIEIGFNRNFEKSPTYINVTASLSDENSNTGPLVISMKYIIGDEVFSSYSPDFRRIEEAYAKCGKELARFMKTDIY